MLRRALRLTSGDERIEDIPSDNEPHFHLSELVAGITEENRHDEIDMGCAVGNEFA